MKGGDEEERVVVALSPVARPAAWWQTADHPQQQQ